MLRGLAIISLLLLVNNTPTVQAQDWTCYNRCMQTERYPAVCNKRCKALAERQQQQQQTHLDPTLSYKEPEDTDKSDTPRTSPAVTCYDQCLAKGLMTKAMCFTACGGAPIDRDAVFTDNNPGRKFDLDFDPEPKRPDDFGVDVECFTDCRNAGVILGVCVDMCATDG